MARYDFGFTTHTCLRLSRVEEILRHNRVIDPIPSRPTLIRMIEDGTLEGVRTSVGYVVYEYSFIAWVKSLQPHCSMRSERKPKLKLASNR
jgi:hypothetical protein